METMTRASRTLVLWGVRYGMPFTATGVVMMTMVKIFWPHLLPEMPGWVNYWWGTAFVVAWLFIVCYLGYQAIRQFQGVLALRNARKRG